LIGQTPRSGYILVRAHVIGRTLRSAVAFYINGRRIRIYVVRAAAQVDGARTRLDSEDTGRRRYAGTCLGRRGKERIGIDVSCPAIPSLNNGLT